MPDQQSPFGAPVEDLDTGSTHAGPEDGIALCLSGGGFRAMLFHLGSLWRLNEAGLLGKLRRVSSVSGGSITAGLLGLKWGRLGFGADGVAAAFVPEVVVPIRRLADETLDAKAIFSGVFGPGSVSDKIGAAYRKHLYGKATLQDLPPDPPRFVINATNVQSGALFRFMRPALRDWKVGELRNPKIDLATAVAASSAFPPVLSPVRLETDPNAWIPAKGPGSLPDPVFRREVVLSDGGVYDNLGLETAYKRYKTLLVSDAGMKMQAEPEPKSDWIGHTLRVFDVVDSQVRALRRRQLMHALVGSKVRDGAFWTIATPIAAYNVPNALPCSPAHVEELAHIKTRLKRMEPDLQMRLINWGYAACDGAIRAYFKPTPANPAGFPYPKVGV
jgi:NTE family protein